ncbi:uncharacterized protein LOC111042133 [Myzus persicae]|uniref:uncharacterized protein LOC111042133 n=1 Tax=Myzus persicae TaxID=13164 RepID=UPI000B930659|nr:uncharacterized protein LOC111042133 [Myzus persicae]
MGFSVSNLMVIAMTVVVVFCQDNVPVTSEENVAVLDWEHLAVYEGCKESIGCQDQLEAAGFVLNSWGVNHLEKLTDDVDFLQKPPSENCGLEKYKEYATEKINEKYPMFSQQNGVVIAYYFGLAINFLNPDMMLPVETWCNIHEKGTYYAKEFLKIDNEPYRKYLQRIANNTGLSKQEQTIVYRSIDVCYGELFNYSKRDIHDKVKRGFRKIYKKVIMDENRHSVHALSFCSINACYETLINAGFLDVSAKENIKEVMLKLNIRQTSGYVFDFYQYLEGIRKGSTDIYQIVNPHDSDIEIKCGYLRNWCSVQVCQADLRDAGYIHEHATDNYLYEYNRINDLTLVPGRKKDDFEKRYHLSPDGKPRIVSVFVKYFSLHLSFTLNNEAHDASHKSYLFMKEKLSNERSRSPLDFCKVTAYENYITKKETKPEE